MTATDATDDDDKNSIEAEYIETLRRGAHYLTNDLDELADALEAGDADSEQVWNNIAGLAHTYVQIEDAAHEAGVIDATADEFRAADQSRKALYHISRANDSDAITAATTAAEYAELASLEDDGE